VIVLAVAAGLVIGGSLGALGGGGSILTVPALVYLLRESPHQATTASLIVVGAAALAGAVIHHRAGRVRLLPGLAFGAAGIAGSYAGSLASAAVPAPLLLAGFGVLMLVVAALMLLRRDRPGGRRPAAGPGRPATAVAAAGAGPALAGPARPSAGASAAAGAAGLARLAARRGLSREVLVVLAAATGVGLITGFFGVGGGFVVVPALVLVLRFDLPAAAGTSLVVIAVNSAAALVARAGHVAQQSWPLLAVFAAATAAGALTAGGLAGRISPRRLNAAFVVLIILVAAYTLARSVPALA